MQSKLNGDLIAQDPEFPNEYELFSETEIKSPLNLLWYNLLTEYEDDYPAKMNPDFARDMIKLYSKEGGIVWDGCCGSGTVPLIANRYNRLGIGTDVNPKAIELAIKHYKKQSPLPVNKKYFVGDARTVDLDRDSGFGRPDLILSSFPFGLNIAGDKNNYSDEVKDISNSKDYAVFFESTKQIIQNYYDNLRDLGIMILDARDRTKEGQYHPLIFRFHNQAEQVGFKTLAVYSYILVPYRMMPHKDKETRMIQPMVSKMDAIVMYKPRSERLI